MTIDVNCVKAITPFLSTYTNADDFHEMVLICYSHNVSHRAENISSARSEIKTYLKKIRREMATLYSKRNISFNECINGSKYSVEDWLNVSDWREWD